MIIYSHNVTSSFMRKDVYALESEFEVKKFAFIPTKKAYAPLSMLSQLAFFLLHGRKAKAYVTLFGGYHSFIPGLFGKLWGKPSIVILGGSDCASFPSINYGNFNNVLQGSFTRWSLELASHIAPVDSSLELTHYDYTDSDYLKQGYKAFCPNVTAPSTTVHFGYDSDMFKRNTEKIPGSFLTVGYLNPANFYRKGIDLIFDQAKRRPECSYTIVGGTKSNLPIGQEVPPNVTLYASVTYEELVEHYSTHQFYFQLSMMEGFPSAICEAMLCECVPIGSNVAAIPNIIGDTGFVLKHKDFEQLNSLVDTALSQVSAQLGTQARERIVFNYPKDERMKLLQLVKKELG